MREQQEPPRLITRSGSDFRGATDSSSIESMLEITSAQAPTHNQSQELTKEYECIRDSIL